MGSSSRASTTTAQTTNQVSRNLNLQDTEGVTIGEAGGNVTVISTDHNAFADASDLARRAVDAGESLGRDALNLSLQQTREVSGTLLDLSKGAISEVGNIAGSALTFGDRAFGTVEKALGEVSGAYMDASAFQQNALQEVSSSSQSFFDKAIAFASNLASKSAETLSSTVAALNDISVEQNKSTDQRLQESTERTLKYALIGFGVLALGLVGFAVANRSK